MARAARSRCCPFCKYDLEGLSRAVNCPECGASAVKRSRAAEQRYGRWKPRELAALCGVAVVSMALLAIILVIDTQPYGSLVETIVFVPWWLLLSVPIWVYSAAASLVLERKGLWAGLCVSALAHAAYLWNIRHVIGTNSIQQIEVWFVAIAWSAVALALTWIFAMVGVSNHPDRGRA